MTSEEIERQSDRLLSQLHNELGGAIEPERIAVIGRGHYDSLVQNAAINDFVPLLVYRFTKEELVDALTARLPKAA